MRANSAWTVNLRIKDIDEERKQLTIRAGKGDRDRVTVLPDALVPIFSDMQTFPRR